MIDAATNDLSNLDDLLFNQDNAAIDAYLDQTADALDALLVSVCGVNREPELLSLLGMIADD
jgi:hypothetical protein